MSNKGESGQVKYRSRGLLAKTLPDDVDSDRTDDDLSKLHRKYHQYKSVIKNLSIALLVLALIQAMNIPYSINTISEKTIPMSASTLIQNNENLKYVKRQKSLLQTLEQNKIENTKQMLPSPVINSAPKNHKESKDSYAKTFKQNKENLKHSKKRLFLCKHAGMIKKIYDNQIVDESIPPVLEWSNIVVVLLTYDNFNANKLLHAQFDTWISKTGNGLDIVIVADVSDVRSDEELLFGLNNKDSHNLYIHRSSAINEKNRARHKVVDAFNYTITKYKDDNNKMYFIKADPDSFIIADRLMNRLRDLHKITYPHPTHFGRVTCANNEVTCHVTGGLYGMNKSGLEITTNYLSENPKVYDTFVPNPTNREENFMVHEDYFMSYLFWKSTFFPKVYIKGISESQSINDDFISFHPIKNFLEMYALHYLFYNGEKLEDISVVQEKYSAVTSIMDFPKYSWNNEKLSFQISPRHAGKAY